MKSIKLLRATVVYRIENGEALMCSERQISRGVASVRLAFNDRFGIDMRNIRFARSGGFADDL